MKIELRKLSSIKPYSGNPRQNDDAVAAVAASLKEFGFRQPIVVDEDDVIVVGHTRWKAAQQLGLGKVPVHVAVGLTPAQIRAYRLADNRTAEIATWDEDLLPLELAELQAANFDLGLLGFDADDLARYLTDVKEGQCDPDEIPEPPDAATTTPGDLWLLGDHRLLCGDSSSEADVDRLLAGAVIHLVNSDPPYNVKVEPRSNNAIAAGLSSFQGTKHHQSLDLARHPKKSKPTQKKLRAKDRPLANDFVTDEAFDKLLDAWFGNMARVLAPGRGFYCWGGYANCANYPPVLKAKGLYFSQAVIWVKEHPVLTRKDFMGNHEWCQPPDTQVLTPYGAVNINSLRQQDRVIPYDTNYHDHLGPRHGEHISVATRHYSGTMHGVAVGDRETHCTDGHIFSVRLDERSTSTWCVYLMQRGPRWRVGKCKVAGDWYGFGLKSRLKQEKAEAAWILTTHDDQASAICAEQLVSVKYGIPTTHWEIYGSHVGVRTTDHIRSIYDGLDLQRLHQNALTAIADHGRRFEHPMVHVAATRSKMGRRDAFTVRACNLLPGLMAIPIVLPRRRVRYEPLRHVDRQHYHGPVYSLDVPSSRHYVADGIVTHNCFYGWREGAAHVYLGPKNVPDVWSVKKVNPQSMIHLTEKPVELAVRAMTYSSRLGENVLDLFGGSGSTLIAAEQTGRRAFLMELDTLYCDVIVERWEKFTGKKAKRETAKKKRAS